MDNGAYFCTSQDKGAIFYMIGERIRAERERLGFTQPVFAEVAGTKKRTLIDWEKGVSSPTATQLAALSEIGADILYIVTGHRTGSSLSDDENELLSLFRSAPLQVKAAAIGALQGGASATSQTTKVSAKHGQAAGRDIVINKGGRET